MNLDAIEQEAAAELDAERHREAVNAAKERIRARRGRPWWKRLVPFVIRIERT